MQQTHEHFDALEALAKEARRFRPGRRVFFLREGATVTAFGHRRRPLATADIDKAGNFEVFSVDDGDAELVGVEGCPQAAGRMLVCAAMMQARTEDGDKPFGQVPVSTPAAPPKPRRPLTFGEVADAHHAMMLAMGSLAAEAGRLREAGKHNEADVLSQRAARLATTQGPLGDFMCCEVVR